MVVAVGLVWGLRANGEDDGLLVAVGVVNPPAKACGRRVRAPKAGVLGGGVALLRRYGWLVGVCRLC